MLAPPPPSASQHQHFCFSMLNHVLLPAPARPLAPHLHTPLLFTRHPSAWLHLRTPCFLRLTTTSPHPPLPSAFLFFWIMFYCCPSTTTRQPPPAPPPPTAPSAAPAPHPPTPFCFSPPASASHRQHHISTPPPPFCFSLLNHVLLLAPARPPSGSADEGLEPHATPCKGVGSIGGRL